MPIFDYKCINATCSRVVEALVMATGEAPVCPSCGALTRKIPSRASIIISGNMGPKLRTRVALDDELKKQGYSTPLFKSEQSKDKAKWALKKVGIR